MLTSYKNATSQVTQAQKDEVALYLAWARSDIQKGQPQTYQAASQHLDTLLGLSFCDAACQASAKPLDAQALHQYGKSQITANACTGAVTTYQDLTRRFPDTTDGQQAAQELMAPQPVSGLFSPGPPAGFTVSTALVPPGTYSNVKTLTSAFVASKYHSSVPTSGAFQFSSVILGDYYLAIVIVYQGQTVIDLITDTVGSTTPLAITVGPLCPTTIPTIS